MAREDLSKIVVQEIAQAGLRYTVEVSKRHIKIRFWVQERSYLYVVAKTSSDHRAAMNNRAGIRRLLRRALEETDLP